MNEKIIDGIAIIFYISASLMLIPIVAHLFEKWFDKEYKKLKQK